MTHPVYRHPDGTTCIWLGTEWFVPLDAGGEGYGCEGEHPGDRERRAVEAVWKLAETWIGFDDSHHYGDAVLSKLSEFGDHPPCCLSCDGKGGGVSGPCWDCRGTGHTHE